MKCRALTGKFHRSNLTCFLVVEKLHVTTLGFAGMRLQLLGPASPQSVDAPTQVVFLVDVIREVDHGLRRLQLWRSRISLQRDQLCREQNRRTNCFSHSSNQHVYAERFLLHLHSPQSELSSFSTIYFSREHFDLCRASDIHINR